MVADYEDGAEPAFGTSLCGCLGDSKYQAQCIWHMVLWGLKRIFDFCSSDHRLCLVLLCCATHSSHRGCALGTKRSSLEGL